MRDWTLWHWVRQRDAELNGLGERIHRSGIYRAAGLMGRFSVVVAAFSYCWNSSEREKTRHYQAWQVIALANSQAAGGGRIEALEDLVADGVPLAGIDLRKALLRGVKLQGADLRGALLDSADLSRATLQKADMSLARLNGAKLDSACLRGAFLHKAQLRSAQLGNGSLQGAILFDARLASDSFSRERTSLAFANLEGADLRLADLEGVDLTGANLRNSSLMGAVLTDAELEGADLRGTNLAGALMYRTGLRDVQNWKQVRSMDRTLLIALEAVPDSFMEWARAQGAFERKTTLLALTQFGQRRRFIRESAAPPTPRVTTYLSSCRPNTR